MSVKTRMLKSIGKLARRQDRGKDTTAYCLDDLSREHLELVEDFIDSFPTHKDASGSSIEEELPRPLLYSPDEERERVEAYLDRITGQCWSDPDPIGFLIGSHRRLDAQLKAVKDKANMGPCPKEYGGMSPFEAAAEANCLLVRQASGVHRTSLYQFITRIYHLARIMGPSMMIQRLPEWNPDKAMAAAQRDIG